VPFDGVNVTPARSLIADQVRLPEAPVTGASVATQVQPPAELATGQLFPAAKLVGLTVSVGGLQFHWAGIEFAGPTKVKAFVLFEQSAAGIEMATCADCVGVSTPLDGVMCTPANVVLTDQLRFP
jgi:hypothetical protein